MELNDEVIEQTPRLLDLSRRVAQSDAEQIEPLYQLAEKWAAQVKYCISTNLHNAILYYIDYEIDIHFNFWC